ncbi:MAG: hypothetical protein MJ192_09150 [Clostridia bacterium]|nr:hypothetical protein [Clostridia bacterium]
MRKRNVISLLAGCLAAAALLTSCGPADVPSGNETETDTQPVSAPVTESESEDETKQPEEKERIVMDVYGNGYNTNMLVGFDEQGHTVDAAAAARPGKQVGIFYFLWLGQPFAEDIYDVSVLLETQGKDVLFHQDVPGVSPNGQPHWWAQPLYGYYNSADEWVIRRHMELLTDAGVDFLVFDTTNAVTYDNVAKKIMKIITELRGEGWNCPQVVFYTHSYSIRTMTSLYEKFYKADVYPESWYRVDGKPMIIGYRKGADDKKATGDAAYNPGDLPQEMLDFFYIRTAQWPDEDPIPDGWPYTDWHWPQSLQTDMISVSIATHPMPPFSFSLTHENWGNRGRGFDVKKGVNVHDDIMKGTFYDAEWETVYDKDPDLVFVTGWNEWVAWKQPYLGEYMLCDNADMEYSRDAEPMQGGYEDAYYIQTIQKIRQFKYQPIEGVLADTVRKTIDVSGSDSQWDGVNAVYRRIGTDDGSRDMYGGSKVVHYEADPVRNNILEVRVTNDAENVYFMIRSETDIETADGADWMNLFIGCGRPEMGKGWEGYEFAVNRTRADGYADVETLNADFSGTVIGKAVYSVQGDTMQIAVPRALLGLEGECDLYFKVADGVEDAGEIMQYYASGRSLPMGRLSYLYQIGKD